MYAVIIHLLYTEQYGFEHEFYDTHDKAVEAAKGLKQWRCYRNVPIEVVSHELTIAQCAQDATV
jgi:hypothetical protein